MSFSFNFKISDICKPDQFVNCKETEFVQTYFHIIIIRRLWVTGNTHITHPSLLRVYLSVCDIPSNPKHQEACITDTMKKLAAHEIPIVKNIEYTASENKVLPTLDGNFPMLKDLKDTNIIDNCQTLQTCLERVKDTLCVGHDP